MLQNLTFNDFCQSYCDGLYNPALPDDAQCSGYHKLKKMVVENITPATLDEIRQWETNVTATEILSVPDLKYMRFMHVLLRPYIIENWKKIKTLKIS